MLDSLNMNAFWGLMLITQMRGTNGKMKLKGVRSQVGVPGTNSGGSVGRCWVDYIYDQERTRYKELPTRYGGIGTTDRVHSTGAGLNGTKLLFGMGCRYTLLFDLVLRLKKLEMNYNLILHVLIHVAGRRMIDQGSDGLSRADHTRGVVTGRDIRHWVHLNRGAVERSIGLEKWLEQFWGKWGFRR
jgi:hypothetical protein